MKKRKQGRDKREEKSVFKRWKRTEYVETLLRGICREEEVQDPKRGRDKKIECRVSEKMVRGVCVWGSV